MNPGKHLITAVATISIAGCSWLGIFDGSGNYLEAKSIERVRIPERLDKPEFTDVMGVPEISDPRGLAGKKMEIGLPEALNAHVDVDKIVIKKLGDTRWVFLDLPASRVWPRIREFFETNNLRVETADPSRGILETQWLAAKEGTADEVFRYFKDGIDWTDTGETLQNKFRLKIEPGVRPDSTEIHIEHAAVPSGAPYRRDRVDWDSKSDDREVEAKVLTELAHYLANTVNQSQSVSLLAGSVRGNRAQLVPDEKKPVLKYKLPFNRAWATVGAALEDARINIEDLDRTSSIYYVIYDNSLTDKPGLLGRLLSFDSEAKATDPNRFLVQLDTMSGEEVHVTVKKDQETLADPLIAERLLQLIKEYST